MTKQSNIKKVQQEIRRTHVALRLEKSAKGKAQLRELCRDLNLMLARLAGGK